MSVFLLVVLLAKRVYVVVLNFLHNNCMAAARDNDCFTVFVDEVDLAEGAMLGILPAHFAHSSPCFDALTITVETDFCFFHKL